MSLYETLRDALRAEEPVALATIVEVAEEGTDGGAGPELGLGAKLLVRPDSPVLGSLGDEALDRVVARDALGALTAGHTSTRHYGRHGEARQREVAVFV